MEKVSVFVLLVVGFTTTIGITVKNDVTAQSETRDLTEVSIFNTTARRGRHTEEIIEIPAPSKKIKRQIIKIPPSVSKVKVVQLPLSLRHNRAPQQFNRYPPIYRSVSPWRPSSKKSPTDFDAGAVSSFPYDPKKIKRNLKRPTVKEVSPEEFFRDEEYEFDFEKGKHRPKKLKKHDSVQKVVKMKRKKPKQSILSEYVTDYETEGKLNREEGGEFDSLKIRPVGTEEGLSVFGYDSAESNIHTKQVPPSSLFPQNIPQQHLADKAFGQFYADGYVPGLSIEKFPTRGRQVQSPFSQQYTTHNPHVATNFGLGEVAQPNGLRHNLESSSEQDFSHLGKRGQPVEAASEQVLSALPAKTMGIQVIQPPQFRDVTVSHPSHSSRLMSPLSQQREETLSQRATIRDILEQDCPSFVSKGYCDSPPRYPMQQIKNMVKKCANLMEVMNTQPFEEPQDVYRFDKRSDNYEEQENKTVPVGVETNSQPSWSRSSNGGLAACTSDLELIEPGYAKEINSGRWFVIVQHPDTIIQRIMADTCRNPGKFCGGLSELKCNKINNLPSKYTKCVQRHTHQRLISWDPELPEECPRMRIFRFPSACICHLDVL